MCPSLYVHWLISISVRVVSDEVTFSGLWSKPSSKINWAVLTPALTRLFAHRTCTNDTSACLRKRSSSPPCPSTGYEEWKNHNRTTSMASMLEQPKYWASSISAGVQRQTTLKQDSTWLGIYEVKLPNWAAIQRKILMHSFQERGFATTISNTSSPT